MVLCNPFLQRHAYVVYFRADYKCSPFSLKATNPGILIVQEQTGGSIKITRIPMLYLILAWSTWEKISSLGINKIFWLTVHNFVSNSPENIEVFHWINALVVLQKPSLQAIILQAPWVFKQLEIHTLMWKCVSGRAAGANNYEPKWHLCQYVSPDSRDHILTQMSVGLIKWGAWISGNLNISKLYLFEFSTTTKSNHFLVQYVHLLPYRKMRKIWLSL